jgi:hypothetical protein
MNDSLKKLLNTISYILNVLFIAYFILGVKVPMGSESADNDNEVADKLKSIKECIVQQENANLPLTKQKMDNVNSIIIDSLVITNHIEPYSGYLVTTWNITERVNLSSKEWKANGYKDKYVEKDKVVYVEVRNIQAKLNGEVSWTSNWTSAYMSIR